MTARDGFGGGVELPTRRHHPTEPAGILFSKRNGNARRKHCNNIIHIRRVSTYLYAA